MGTDLFQPLGEWFFKPLPVRYFNFLAIDPPWNFSLYSELGAEKSALRHYDCMSDAAILSLPVADLADEHCLVYLWATAPQLPLAISCVEAWGFSYKTFMVWEKVSPAGKVLMGTGYRVRTTGEIIVIGARGEPRQAWTPRTIFRGVRREHSRKPEEFYQLCERVMPNARRADIFARERRPGWHAFGDQLDHFSDGMTAARPMRSRPPAHPSPTFFEAPDDDRP